MGDAADVNDVPGSKTLHAIRGNAGWHLVTPDVIEEAREAQARATPYVADYGELRRSGDLDELADRLDTGFGIGLDDYTLAIEQSAGVEPAGTTIGERLAALADVDFPGDDDANAPADTDGFRSEHELENEVEDHYLFTIEQGMVASVPNDVLAAFDARWSPTFGEGDFAMVDDEHLEAMIATLEARGYTIIRN